MQYRILTLAVAICFMPACNQPDQPEALQQANRLPDLHLSPDSSQLQDSEINNGVTAKQKIRHIDTTITPEMIRGIQFASADHAEVDDYSDRPFNVNPDGLTQISVTPKLFFKEELDFSQGYLENIEGAFVQFEMKFD